MTGPSAPRFRLPGLRRALSSPSALAVLLALATAAVFARSLTGGFVFDDNVYVWDNPYVRQGLNWDTLRWAFTSTYAAFWHPVTWISHLVDVELFGLRPAGHHATSVTIHGLNTLLLFHVLRRLTGATGRSALVAALFALHPLRVESVAWISERKDLLSALFFFATLGTYRSYAVRPGLARYLGVATCFLLALASKSMAVTLPFVLLLLDYWPLGRFGIRGSADRGARAARLVAEKAPLLLLAAAVSVVSYVAQREFGAVSADAQYPLAVRLMNAVYSYGVYLKKTVWPLGLAAFYPHPGPALALWKVALSSLFVLGVSAIVVRRPGQPYLAVGWFWFLGTLVPVIGFVQLGDMGMADRFTYLPHVGLFLAAAWLAGDAWESPRLRPALAAAAASMLLAFSLISVHQIGYWRDDLTLFRHTLAVTDRNPLAENNVGHALVELGALEEAESHLLRAAELDPRYVDAHVNLGRLYSLQGRTEPARRHLERALSLDPRSPAAHVNLGTLLAESGEHGAAEGHLREAIRLSPRLLPARFNLGVLLATTGRREEAILAFREVLARDPDNVDARANIASLEGASPPVGAHEPGGETP